MGTRCHSPVISDELQPEFLLGAYRLGAFPMADDAGHIGWYHPDPRAILELERFRVPRSLRQRIRRGNFETRVNSCFETVVRCCADRAEGTWISAEMIEAYCRLHSLGYAHSMETYYGSELAGGLYGVSIGGAFFGESMFTRLTDGSKLALVALVQRMKRRGLELLDIQFMTPHLARFGAGVISAQEYLRRLAKARELCCRFAD